MDENQSISQPPSLNGENRRDARGRFLNCPGPGAPANKLRARLNKAIKERDITNAVAVLREIMLDPNARTSDRLKAVEIFIGQCGKPPDPIEERIARLETMLAEREQQP